MPSGKHVTLKMIAREAGVSVMTVSRALRNQSNLAESTKKQIQEIAKRMGYRPNPMVTALMNYRRAGRPVDGALTLGFVTNFKTRAGWRESRLNVEFFEGALACADRHGYKLEEFWLSEPGMTGKRLSKILYNRNINGLIVAPLPVALGHIRLEWDLFSAIALGYSLAWPSLHRAVNHQFRSMRMAMRRLRKKGYRRAGLALRASIDERVEHHWVGGFLVEQLRAAPRNRVPLHVLPDKQWTQDRFNQWFRQSRPDVILSQHEEIMDWLKALNVQVPRDVGFVHLNCTGAPRAFSGLYQNGKAVGEGAVDYLVGMIQRNERGIPDLSHSILIQGTWQEGGTLAG